MSFCINNVMLLKYLLVFSLSSIPFLSSLNGDFVFDDTEAIINNKDITSEAWMDVFYNDFWVILAGMAMLFKENGITVLGFCLIYELVLKFGNGKMNNYSEKKLNLVRNIDIKTLIRILITSLAALLLLYSRWLIMGEMKPEFHAINNPAAYTSNLFTKVVTFNYIYFLNFLLLVWPQWLCYDWSMGCIPLIETIHDYRILFVLLIDLFAILHIKAILHQRNKESSKRLTILAISLLIVPFLPASNILFPVGFVIAERILYLPSAGYCLLLAIGLNKLCCNIKAKVYKAGIAAFALLVVIYTFKTWQRAYDWQTEYSLFISGLSVCPLNAKVHYNVAKVADARHHTAWALSEYRKAISLHPEYYQAMNNLANLLKDQKQYTEAEFYLRKSISLKEDFPAAWMNLGIILSNTKRYKESENAYKTALRYRRNYPDCLYNLGNLYLAINNTKAATENWLAAIHLNPKHTFAWTNLIVMYDNTGQTEKALQIIPKALAELPNTPSLIFAIANIYGRMNKFTEAENHFKKAIKLIGKEVQAIHYANFGVLYHRWKKYNIAKAMYKRALDIDPLFKSAKKNLALLHDK